jgi:hypothetical protein
MPISQILLTAGSGGSPTPAINIYGWTNRINEGSTNTVYVDYEDYPSTTIYWRIVNDGTENADWLNGTIPSGSFAINGTGSTSFSWTTAEDLTTEGDQNYLLEVGTTLGGNDLLNETLTITDTSITPPTPTYSLAPGGANNINEGSGLQFNVGGTDVPAGTYYWTIETGAEDFATTDGTVSVSAGTGSSLGSFILTPSADATTEGTEQFTVALRSVSITGDILASSGADINDTSLDPEPVTALVSAWNNVSNWLLPSVAGNPDLTPVVAGWTVTGPFAFTATVIGSPFSNGTNWVIPVDASLAEFTPSNAGNYTFTPPA